MAQRLTSEENKSKPTMVADDETQGPPPRNLLETMMAEARERYVEENGEEPPEKFMEEARELILRTLAQRGRDKHQDVYDALAEE